jgi:hypothetical protein
MFETTVRLVRESPIAVVPLLTLVWFVGTSVRERDDVAYRVLRRVLAVGVAPLVALFVLAELTAQRVLSRLATSLLDLKADVAAGLLSVADSLLAALLRAFLAVVRSATPALPSWNPFAVLSAAGFLVAVFGVHFLAGSALVWVTRESAKRSSADGWLTGAGGILFVSGVVWMVMHIDALDLSRLEREFAVLATSLGVTVGVVVTALSAKLNLRDTADRSERPTSSRADTDDHRWKTRYERLKEVIRTAARR